MSRAIVQQFSAPGYDRAIDVEEIDRAFLEIAGIVNGGITLDNVDPAQKFSFLNGSGCIQFCSSNYLTHYEMRGELAHAENAASIPVGVVPYNSYLMGVSAVLFGGSPGDNITLNLGASPVTFAPKKMDATLSDAYGWGSQAYSVRAGPSDGLVLWVTAGTMITVTGPRLYSGNSRISLIFSTSVMS